jgi:AcrR family transcriptional regulator
MPASPKHQRPARRDATENRAALIEAARTSLQADPDASLETIAAAAGLSRRAVYGHFPSRDDLVREVVTSGAARILAAVPTGSALDPLSPVTRLAVIAAALWAEVSHVRSMAQIAVHGPFMEQIGTVLAPVRRAVREACALGAEDGTLRSDVTPGTLARLVEGACFAVLDEATRSETSTADGHRMVVLSALGMAGLDWRSATEVLAAIPAPTPAGTTTNTESRA